jgi:hypothetical protein
VYLVGGSGGGPSVTMYDLHHTLFSTSLRQVQHCSHCRLLFLLLCTTLRRESRPVGGHGWMGSSHPKFSIRGHPSWLIYFFRLVGYVLNRMIQFFFWLHEWGCTSCTVCFYLSFNKKLQRGPPLLCVHGSKNGCTSCVWWPPCHCGEITRHEIHIRTFENKGW